MKSNIWKMHLISFVASFSFMGGILVPFFTDWGKISFSQTLTLQSWFMICCFVFEFPSGGFADRFGKKLSLTLGLLLNGIGFLIYGSIPNFWIFCLGELVLAIGCSLISGTESSLIACTLNNLNRKHQKKIVLGRNKSFGMIGMLISAALGSIVAHYFGLREAVLITATCPLIAFVISLTLTEPNNGVNLKSFKETLINGFFCFKKSKALTMITFDKIIVQVFCFFLIWIYQPFLRQEGLEIIYFGTIHALICLSQIMVLSNLPKFEKFFGGDKNFLFFSSFVSGLFLFLIGISLGNIFFKIFGILVISAFGLSRPTLSTNYMLEHIEEAYQTTALSFAEMFRKIITAILYPLVGFLMDWSINYTFIILGIALIIFSFIPTIKKEYLVG
ncbi:MAG: MFS transporter [Patescibacteria group bacterium]